RLREEAADARLDDELRPVIDKRHLQRVGVPMSRKSAEAERTDVEKRPSGRRTENDEPRVGEVGARRSSVSLGLGKAGQPLSAEEPKRGRVKTPGDSSSSAVAKQGREPRSDPMRIAELT